MASAYQRLRDWLIAILDRNRFVCYPPSGGYYVMTDISGFGLGDDVAFAKYLAEEIGVACIPGSSFYLNPRHGSSLVRFCFSKRDDTIREAERRLAKLSRKVTT